MCQNRMPIDGLLLPLIYLFIKLSYGIGRNYTNLMLCKPFERFLTIKSINFTKIKQNTINVIDVYK